MPDSGVVGALVRQEQPLPPFLFEGAGTGRFPSIVDDPGLLRVLAAIAEARVGFKAACLAEGWNPVMVRQWACRDQPQGFKALYREARRIEMDGFQDEMMEVGRGEHRGSSKERDAAGSVYRDQLVTKLMQWRMQRQAPDEFGDRGVVGEDGKAVPKQVILVGTQTITF